MFTLYFTYTIYIHIFRYEHFHWMDFDIVSLVLYCIFSYKALIKVRQGRKRGAQSSRWNSEYSSHSFARWFRHLIWASFSGGLPCSNWRDFLYLIRPGNTVESPKRSCKTLLGSDTSVCLTAASLRPY